MRHGIVLFTCDRGITPAQAARAAEERGFDTFYVPEHTREVVEGYLDRLAGRVKA